MVIAGDRKIRAVICLGLALITVAAFHGVLRNDFINFDDPDYVTANREVLRGLTLDGVAWAFTHAYAGNWHPLTWISHMIDCQLFDLHPGAHHAVNLAIHILNTLLLFLALDRMTGRPWRSAVVAGLFAVHPLHVESVAWIAERKDMLSTLFALLTILAYARYAHNRPTPCAAGPPDGAAPPPDSRLSTRDYSWALLWFALGLMSKPMLVTLPFVLLLLDFWPLRRAAALEPAAAESASGAVSQRSRAARLARTGGRLAWEKWPFFLLAAISSVITFVAQKSGGAVASLEYYPISFRIENALVSYVRYVGKMLWPANLAVSYPLTVLPWWQPAAAALVLLLTSVAAIRAAKARPYWLTGWFWFVGTLVPVIGLVQVGRQAFADRYTYIPLIGLFLAIVWTIADFASAARRRRRLCGAGACIALLACVWISTRQVTYWKDSLRLFGHAVAVTRDNGHAENDYAAALVATGRIREAFPHYAAAARIEPRNPLFQNNYGSALAREGQVDAAREYFLRAIALQPTYADPYNNLGMLLADQHRLDEAIGYFERALALKPDHAEAHNNLGGALALEGKPAEAAGQYIEALRLKPDDAGIHFNLGVALLKLGQVEPATAQFSEAIRLRPADSAEARAQLGRCLFLQGKIAAAADQFSEVLRSQPDHAEAQFYLALTLLTQGKMEPAVGHLRDALRLRPDWVEPMDVLASVLASTTDAQVRNGAEAVRWAERAVSLTRRERPEILNTLAAAYAEAGRFDDAIATANEACQLARRSGQTNLLATSEANLKRYQSHQPLRLKPGE